MNERFLHSKKITKKTRYIKVKFLEKKIKSKYTINLIKYIKRINPSINIYYIMGADSLINFNKWKKWKEIIKLCKIIVFDRKGFKSKAFKSKALIYMDKSQWKFIKFKKVNISSSQIRKIW